MVAYRLAAGLGLALASLVGCGEKSAEAPAEKTVVDTGPKLRVVDPATLPKLAAPLPPLDKGRLELAPPDGWYVAPRGSLKGDDFKDAVTLFRRSTSLSYPAIIVRVAEIAEIDRVTRENRDTFVSALQAEFDADAEIKLVEKVAPFEVGEFFGATYLRRAGGTPPVDRLFVTTVLGGRQYTLELRSTGDLEATRKQVEAVAASMKLVKSVAAVEPAKTDSATTEPSKTDPAKSGPAKTEPAKTEQGKTEPAKTAGEGKTSPLPSGKT